MRFVACTPMSSISSLNNEIDSFFGDLVGVNRSSAKGFPVNMDLFEDENSFKITVDLPGMEKDKIKILVENDILTISGERARGENGDSRVLFSQRFFGAFSRSFRLPETIDKSGVSADYKNGILEVSLPKKAETKPKEIEVKVA